MRSVFLNSGSGGILSLVLRQSVDFFLNSGECFAKTVFERHFEIGFSEVGLAAAFYLN